MATLYSMDVSTGDYDQPLISTARGLSLQRFRSFLKLLASGGNLATTTLTVRNTAVRATGTLTMASSSGTVGGVINGVTVTVTWATSDTLSAAALATAINASSNALVNKHVTATSALGVVTLTAAIPGYAGNAITLTASGTNVTASVARLASGSSTDFTLSY